MVRERFRFVERERREVYEFRSKVSDLVRERERGRVYGFKARVSNLVRFRTRFWFCER